MDKRLSPDVVVNGEVISRTAIATETQNHEAPKGKPHLAWRKASQALAIRSLLLQEAKKRGLKAEPVEVGAGRVETDEEALIRGLLESAVHVAKPSLEEVQEEWNRDPSRFKTPVLWEASHILCSCDPRSKEEKEKALLRASSILEAARKDTRGFAALAARESDCSSKDSGGSLGQLGPGDTVPEFEAALRVMKAGEVSPEPVLTRFGYHVIHLGAMAEGETLPFEAVQENISEALEKLRWAKAAQEFTKELVSGAQISGVPMTNL
ncbi:peptidylprolyl isomerase [Flexibacterium corallicola]|uniref:peptidylprolyl isomerase n=1 Tax=Flexibacterium corallicola TaxID=3037259 RepID=UPI00286EBF2F|nr:peptidylprolyl isomerase [Pseudovibrio sp. M1P-2-3]